MTTVDDHIARLVAADPKFALELAQARQEAFDDFLAAARAEGYAAGRAEVLAVVREQVTAFDRMAENARLGSTEVLGLMVANALRAVLAACGEGA